MKSKILFLFIGFLAGVLVHHLLCTFLLAPAILPVFSPDAGGDIISFIDSAERSIDIEMYVFTSRDIVDALTRAKARGVDIRIILERNTISGSNDGIFDELASKGFIIKFASSAYKLTHSKFMIVDGNHVLVGSHNFSNSALYFNREASVWINDPETAQEFLDAFETDWLLAL